MEIIEVGFLICLIALILKTFQSARRESTYPKSFPVVIDSRVKCEILQINARHYRSGELLAIEDALLMEKIKLQVSNPGCASYTSDQVFVSAVNFWH